MNRKRNLIIAELSKAGRYVGLEVITFIMIVVLFSGIGLAQGNGNGNGNGNGGGGNGGGGGGNAPNPTNLTATAVSGSRILVDWSSGGGETAGFIVCYLEGSTPRKKCANGTQIDVGNATSAELSNLDRNISYGIRVSAYNGSGSLSSGTTTTTATLDLPDFVETQVSNDFSGFGNVDTHEAMAIQADGKIVAAGKSATDSPSQAEQDMLVVRYNSDGSLDSNFGAGGSTRIDFLGSLDRATSLLLDSSGKILVAGQVFETDIPFVGVVRLNSDGSLDSTFGSGGKTILQPFDNNDRPIIFMLSSGKILVVGSGINEGIDGDIYVARLNADGSIDTSFGTDGFVITDLNSGSADNVQYAAMEFDGKLVMVGNTDDIATISRFNADGSLDTSYGTGGFRTVDLAGGNHSQYRGIAIDSNDSAMAVGRSYLGADDMEAVVTKFDSSGSIVTSFGNNGTYRTDPSQGNDFFRTALIDGDKIVVTGLSKPGAEGTIVRLNTDGSVDYSFFAGGMYFFDSDGYGQQATSLDSFGRYVIVGAVRDVPNGRNSLLMRFNQ